MSPNSRELSTGAFAYSHHVQFTGPVNFTENTVSHNTPFHPSDGLAELYKRCSREAIFDSQLRDTPPAPNGGYLAETNLRRIRRWGNRTDGPSVLWLYGPTKTGKTAMAHRLAEEWAEQDRLIATYMFSSTQSKTSWGWSKNKEEQPPPIILTLAFQLARARQDIAAHIRNIYDRDPSIYDSVMQKQFKELIVRPLLASEHGLHPVIIIVDALEQCEHNKNQQNQQRILNFLTSTVASGVPGRLKVFICSRADPEIETHMIMLPETHRLILGTSNAQSMPDTNPTALLEDTKYDSLIDVFRLHKRLARSMVIEPCSLDRWSFVDHKLFNTTEAMFESSSRPNTTCFEGTSQTVLNHIRDWSNNPAVPSVLWLSGSVGSGKSCIARTLAKEWERSRALATFDFSVEDPHFFIITCAYQLFRSQSPIYDAGIERRICSLIDSVKRRSTSEQFETLITPFLRPEQHAAIIFIDALDECVYPEVRADVLDFITSVAITSTSSTVKFLISSRPQRQIRQTMEEIFIAGRLEKISLERTRETDSDIAKYLEHKFSIIQTTTPLLHYDDSVITELVQRSAGLFIFASVVASYVEDAQCNPGARLDSVMNVSTTTDTIQSGLLENLDALYLNILQSSGLEPALLVILLRHALMNCTPTNIKSFVTDIIVEMGLFSKLRSLSLTKSEAPSQARPQGFVGYIEHCLLASGSKSGRLELEKLDFSYTENYLEKLRPLKPLLIIPENSSQHVRIRHASFEEFLKDKTRSKQYYVQV